jgi:predicted Zn-dependent protease
MDKARFRFTTLLLAILGLGFISPLFAADADFTMTIPSGWTQRTQSTALAQYKKGPGSFIVTADVMPQQANTPDAYIVFIKQQLGGTFKGIGYDPVIAGKKDGNDTRELKYTVDASGMKMKFDVLYIFNKGKAYTLTAASMADFYTASFAADIKVFFTSFKFK